MGPWTKRPFAPWLIGKSPRVPAAWFRSARPGKVRRCPTRNTTKLWNGVSSRLARGARARVRGARGPNRRRGRSDPPRHAEGAGADAVLVVTPYYNKPTQQGLYQHFKAINDAIGIPIIIYNIPSRSIIDMAVDTM